jgi:hypothetical protein
MPKEVAMNDVTHSVEIVDGAFTIDAALIGQGFGIDPELVTSQMREGKLTSRCERGLDRDAGRYRLTFFFDNRRFHLIVDEAGHLVERSATVDAPPRVSSRSAREGGT